MNPESPRMGRRVFIAALVAIQAFCVGVRLSSGGDATWTGVGNSGDWSTTLNWSTIPTTSGSWNLVFGGGTYTTSTNTIGTITLGTMAFTNDDSAGQTATFTLSGSTLALSNATITTTGTTSGGTITDTVGNALSLTAVNTILLGSGHNLTLSGAIDGVGSLAATGPGTLNLTGSSNSYSGGTTITGGIVQNGLTAEDFFNSAFGTGDIAVSGSGAVRIRNNSTITNNFTLSGSGAGIGALRGSFGTANQTATILGSVTLTGDAMIQTAATASGTGGKLVLAGAVNLGSNTLTLNPNMAASTSSPLGIDVTGVVSGSGSLVVSGTGVTVVYMNNANTYSGGTTLEAGILRVGNDSALGTGGLAVNGGTLDLNGRSLLVGALSGSTAGLITSTATGSASLTVNSASTSTYAGSISNGTGIVSLVKTGGGTLNLNGSSSYSGGTTITGGIIQNGLMAGDYVDSAFGTGDIAVSGSGAVRIRNNSTITNNFTLSGSGAGIGALRGSFGTANQTATILGSVTLTGDAMIQTAATASGTGGKLVLAGAVNLGSNTLTLNPNMAASTSSPLGIDVTGVVSGSGSVVVRGTGSTVVFMNNANTYSGGTTLESGILRVGNGSALGTGGLAVNGGTLDVNGKALSVASLQLSDPATALMSISGTGVGDFAHVISSGAVDFAGTLLLDFTQNGFATGDSWQLFSSGSSSFSGGFSSIMAAGAYGPLAFTEISTGEWRADIGTPGSQWFMFYENNNHNFQGRFAAGQLVLVPEPSTLVCAGIGIAIAAWSRIRKHRRDLRLLRTAA